MKFDDLNDDPTEATMSDTATPRYGFEPTAAFATTRAGAERRARETVSAAISTHTRTDAAPRLLRRLVTLVTGSPS
jgi:hypothetical protein